MKFFNITGIVAALVLSAGASSASTIFADEVISSNQGSCIASAIPGPKNANGCLITRSDASNALGAPDAEFFALGDGGDITLGFAGRTFSGGETETYEVTFDREVNHNEAIDLFAVLGGVETFVATLFNAPTGVAVATIFDAFDSLKLVDVTVREFGALTGPGTSSFDGFDVNAVGVTPIPLPATGLMLLTGLGGLTLARRRRKAA